MVELGARRANVLEDGFDVTPDEYEEYECDYSYDECGFDPYCGCYTGDC